MNQLPKIRDINTITLAAMSLGIVANQLIIARALHKMNPEAMPQDHVKEMQTYMETLKSSFTGVF